MSDLPVTSLLNCALQNNSQIKTNYLWVKANYLQVLEDTCREIFDYSRARLELELSGTVWLTTYVMICLNSYLSSAAKKYHTS